MVRTNRRENKRPVWVWVVGPAVMQSGQVSGEGSNGVVMKRVEGDQKKKKGTCHLLSAWFYPYFISSISDLYLERLMVIYGESCVGNMDV